MPLDRAHITVASRITLPLYVLLFGVIGAGYLFGQAHRLYAAPMLRFADRIMPLGVWGGLFLSCALLMAFAMHRKNRMLYRYALWVCVLSMLVWAVVAVVGVFFEPVTWSAWVWPFSVAGFCLASERSLAKGEVN